MSSSTLMDAPAYDPTRDRIIKASLITVVVLAIAGFLIGFGGFVAGHGWFFSNFGYEHKVNRFFEALEAKDYKKAYALYENDDQWEQHPDKFGYPLNRFIEDWTTHSPVNGPIREHHVDVSKSDGSGNFGTGIIVAVRVNGNHKLFMYVNRADGTMTWPAPHELQY
ncbi:MAG: hypothetical protein PW735_01460 [Acidobacteriaceae bacterium]|nr:hypothetical protein [Acidobacteriaceae bacterium]